MAAQRFLSRLGLFPFRFHNTCNKLHLQLRTCSLAGFSSGAGASQGPHQSNRSYDFDSGAISEMRKAYKGTTEIFDVGDLVSKDPFKQFLAWFEEASQVDSIREANAMSLATSTKDGIPSVRMVLMKGIDETGIYFYTNFQSQKAKELEENPNCSIMFYWEALNRSVRVNGVAERISEEESTKYFHSRPKASQIGACVSLQSQVISSRKVLDDRNEELTKKYSSDDTPVPKPDYWGGFKVIPSRFEFWQGQTNRLHDRIVFRKLQPNEEINSETTAEGSNGWFYERLMP
ncbi:hypothetical protein EGW08_020125 [Elysia chlorotica]|uniref:pyridoxal 5'-phosphate synthase n=1 Tax=Elysia chlorotica TaxID=188477 RepID=A0A3S1AZB4_ELYCH|nr:hypothetical protein EGW08_020125 [Elysia chlorotica]